MSVHSPPALSDRVARYPFPLPRDSYRYSANVEPAGQLRVTAAGGWGAHRVDVDGEHHAELAERDRILTADPTRHQCLPHMAPAAWEAMVFLMRELAARDPERMSLSREGGRWHWRNESLHIDQVFTFGDAATLPEPPLLFIGKQIQEDVVLLDQRADQLWLDAGLVTFAADWSLGFDVGMTFLQVHGPVPRIHREQVITRAHDFLLRLEAGRDYRRTNWTLTVDGRLDTATETYPEWGRDRRTLAEGPRADVGDRLCLRTEVQHLIRLPHSGAVMFLIRTYLLTFREVASVPEWGRRLHDVLLELPQDLADYKGLGRTREAGIDWLRTNSDMFPNEDR